MKQLEAIRDALTGIAPTLLEMGLEAGKDAILRAAEAALAELRVHRIHAERLVVDDERTHADPGAAPDERPL